MSGKLPHYCSAVKERADRNQVIFAVGNHCSAVRKSDYISFGFILLRLI
jgi:hypothetical protein